MTCETCGGDMCPHGVCSDNWCGEDDMCMECYRQRQRELDADIEAAWQRDVIGPMLGFSEEEI